MRDMIGTYLQLVGLLTVGSALILGVQARDSSTELTLMAFGACVFWLGYSMGGGKKSSSL